MNQTNDNKAIEAINIEASDCHNNNQNDANNNSPNHRTADHKYEFFNRMKSLTTKKKTRNSHSHHHHHHHHHHHNHNNDDNRLSATNKRYQSIHSSKSIGKLVGIIFLLLPLIVLFISIHGTHSVMMYVALTFTFFAIALFSYGYWSAVNRGDGIWQYIGPNNLQHQQMSDPNYHFDTQKRRKRIKKSKNDSKNECLRSYMVAPPKMGGVRLEIYTIDDDNNNNDQSDQDNNRTINSIQQHNIVDSSLANDHQSKSLSQLSLTSLISLSSYEPQHQQQLNRKHSLSYSYTHPNHHHHHHRHRHHHHDHHHHHNHHGHQINDDNHHSDHHRPHNQRQTNVVNELTDDMNDPIKCMVQLPEKQPSKSSSPSSANKSQDNNNNDFTEVILPDKKF